MEAILEAFNESKLLSKCIICGSWSMYFYQYIFSGFIPPIATTDIDIFLPDIKHMPCSKLDFLFKKRNYYRNDDLLSGKTIFFSKNGFEIEFLTSSRRDYKDVIYIKELGVGVETLTKLDILKTNYISIKYKDMNINIPSPTTYCIQKILVIKSRTKDKILKDVWSIRYVLNFVNASHKYRHEFLIIFNALPKRWKKEIIDNANTYSIDIPND